MSDPVDVAEHDPTPFVYVHNEQHAPYPGALQELVDDWRFVPGWEFALSMPDFERDPACVGLTLIVTVDAQNSWWVDGSTKRKRLRVAHYFPVPPATYNALSWRRWLLDMSLRVLAHEGCEFATVTCSACGGCGTLPESDGDYEGAGVHDIDCAQCSGTGRMHPFAPNHGPGEDPYRIVEHGSDLARRTQFTGEVR